MIREELNKHRISSPLRPPVTMRGSFVRSNMLLIGVFAVGILCVYMLGLREPPRTASGQQSAPQISVEFDHKEVDKSESVCGLKPGEGMAIVDTFYYQAKQRQIPIGALVGNPFVTRSPRLAAPSLAKTPIKGDDAQSDSMAEAIERVKKLKLQSVLMATSGTTAMVSGQLLTKGQQIRGWTVVHIEPRRVVLAWRDQKFALEMSQ